MNNVTNVYDTKLIPTVRQTKFNEKVAGMLWN